MPIPIIKGAPLKGQDFTSKTFGKLTVIGFSGRKFYRSGGVKKYWACRCECGIIKDIGQEPLQNGQTISCGCLGRERRRISLFKHGFASPTDGKRRHPVYSVWASMIQRCTNPKIGKQWKDYGGRGIKVCERWLSFEAFALDMLTTWKAGLTLERRNVDGNYCPENCCWITRAENTRNRRIGFFAHCL